MDKATLQCKLGAVLRRRRELLGFSQDRFADTIGMHRAYYSAVERGERNTTLATIHRVAAGLNESMANLFKDAGL